MASAVGRTPEHRRPQAEDNLWKSLGNDQVNHRGRNGDNDYPQPASPLRQSPAKRQLHSFKLVIFDTCRLVPIVPNPYEDVP